MPSSTDGDFLSGMTRRERRLQAEIAANAASLFTPADKVAAAEQTNPAEQPTSTKPATILTVCTGNICRSPMGEILLRAKLADLGVRVHSAGTHALVDHEMTEQSRDIAVRLGATPEDSTAHRARYLVDPILRETDLALAMSREHRSHIVQMMPSMLRRTFTLREFARLASTMSAEDIRAAVEPAGSEPGARLQALARAVGERRGLSHPAAPDDDDIIDPYRRSQETYEKSAAQLAPAAEQAVVAIRAALA